MFPLLEISGKQEFLPKLSTNHPWISGCSRNPKAGKSVMEQIPLKTFNCSTIS